MLSLKTLKKITEIGNLMKQADTILHSAFIRACEPQHEIGDVLQLLSSTDQQLTIARENIDILMHQLSTTEQP